MELYKIVFKEVERIINANDPIGLIKGGAPNDEYHAEIGKIVNLLRTESNEKFLADKVQEVFKESFGNEIKSNKDLYLKISRQLLDLKKRQKWWYYKTDAAKTA